MCNENEKCKEIEVTPEMLEAGVECFYELPELLGPSKDELSEALKRAFLRMLEVNCEQLPENAITPKKVVAGDEITLQMLEAGASALDDFFWRLDWQGKPIGKGMCRYAAEAVCRAMLAKRSAQ